MSEVHRGSEAEKQGLQVSQVIVIHYSLFIKLYNITYHKLQMQL